MTTPARLCAACDVPVRETIICTRCERQLSTHLADMPEHHRELKVALARQTRMTAPNDGGRAFEQPLVFSIPASDVIHSLRSLLVSWCRLLAEEADCVLPADTVTAMSEHLRANIPILRRHEAVGEMVAEVRTLVADIMQTVDVPLNRASFVVGPCVMSITEDLGGGTAREHECPGKVIATVPTDESIRPEMKCTFCGQTWFAESWSRVGEQILRKMHGQQHRAVVA